MNCHQFRATQKSIPDAQELIWLGGGHSMYPQVLVDTDQQECQGPSWMRTSVCKVRIGCNPMTIRQPYADNLLPCVSLGPCRFWLWSILLLFMYFNPEINCSNQVQILSTGKGALSAFCESIAFFKSPPEQYSMIIRYRSSSKKLSIWTPSGNQHLHNILFLSFSVGNFPGFSKCSSSN